MVAVEPTALLSVAPRPPAGSSTLNWHDFAEQDITVPTFPAHA